MAKIIIQEETTKNPLSLIGKEAGICWGADILDKDKNIKRAVDCIKSGHGRVMEYPQIYFVIDGYSAKVVREFYTHIGSLPSRLQASTRYINYSDFDYIVPPTIEGNSVADEKYRETMNTISKCICELIDLGIPNEDATMVLPLAMTTKVVVRTNLRHLVDMSRQRTCLRAYHEYRNLMRDLIKELRNYSDEWATIVDDLGVFHAKCKDLGYCPEKNGCGRFKKKGE